MFVCRSAHGEIVCRDTIGSWQNTALIDDGTGTGYDGTGGILDSPPGVQTSNRRGDVEIRDVVVAEGLSERDRRRLVRELTDYMERLDEMKASILRVP